MTERETPSKKTSFRAGFVALVGEPNAGKSTLLNVLLGEKAAIVSAKPQTTRGRVTGILTRDDAQIVFVDTPGLLKSTSGINKFLQEEAADVIENADVVCALLSSDATEESVRELFMTLNRAGKPWVAVITKADLLTGTRTPRFFEFLMESKTPFVSISAKRRPDEAREELLSRVVPLLPSADAPLYDPEIYTTQTLRQMAAEFVREACFENLRQEVPYGLAVKVLSFNENGAVVKVTCQLIVDRESHKGIVIGSKGSMLKTIGTAARMALQDVVGRQVFLELHVQVKEGWTKNPRMMKELGYVVAKD